jgi:hypothetical protein
LLPNGRAKPAGAVLVFALDPTAESLRAYARARGASARSHGRTVLASGIASSIGSSTDLHKDIAKQKRKEERDLTDPQVRAAWLKPYHFKKGQSGNPAGRAPSSRAVMPITDAYVWVLEQPYPPSQREKLETMLGINLRKDLTFAQAIALGRALGAVTDTATADSIANRVQGLLRQSMEMSGAGGCS